MLIRVRPLNQANVASIDARVWYKRLGHVNKQTLQQMFNKSLVLGADNLVNIDFTCEDCKLSKSHCLPFNKKVDEPREYNTGDFFYTDVCGTFQVESLGGARYFLILKDHNSGYRSVFFLKHKSDVFEKFKLFNEYITNHFGHAIKGIRCDNGREFINAHMKGYMASKGIKLETTAPYTPQQNGRAERENRTLVECARTMLNARKLPKFLWGEAINTAAYLLNRTPNAMNKSKTPYEMWNGKRPSVNHLRIFGSTAYAHIPDMFRKKLDEKAKKTILVGYEADSNNYRLYDPNSRKIIQSRHVTFEEFQLLSINHTENVLTDLSMTTDGSSPREKQLVMTETEKFEIEQKSDEACQSPRKSPMISRLRDRSSLCTPTRYQANYVEICEPSTYTDAISSPESHDWIQAIREELDAHKENCTWSIVPRPEGINVIDSRWVFKVQAAKAGKVARFKARLCARGFRQQYGVDYEETFAPVVRYDTLRLLLAIATHEDFEMIQFDVRTAFLYGKLNEDVYMEVPEGSIIDQEDVVCKLEKALYGLKQASRCWNLTFSDYLSRYNLRPCISDTSVYVGCVSNSPVYLALFVDDGLVMAKDKKILDEMIEFLKSAYKITVSDPEVFVGVQIERDRERKEMFIHQSLYIDRVLKRFNMHDCSSVSTPAETGLNLLIEKTNVEDSKLPFRELVGSLSFIALMTRPDIAFSVNYVSRFMYSYDRKHFELAKRILRYLRGTHNHGIRYRASESISNLECFSDADYAGDINIRRPTSGYIFKLSNAPISW